MKVYYLSQNHITKEYCLDYGAFSSRREILAKDSDFLIDALRNKIDRRRNSVLHIVQDEFPSEYIKQIRKFFSDSKVKVDLESLASIEKHSKF